MAADGWFPDINSKGGVISGSGTITLTDPNGNVRLLGPGVRPKFVTDDLTVYSYGYGSRLVGIRNFDEHGNPTDVTEIATGYNVYAGGNGDWAGIIQKPLTDLHIYRGATRTVELQGYGIPVMSPNGGIAVSSNYASNNHDVIWNGITVFSGVAMNLSLCGSAVAIQVAISMYGRKVLGVKRASLDTVEDWTLYDWEDPVVCDQPDGSVWVLSVTQNSFVVLRPAGEKMGYKLEGEWYNPAVRFINGKFMVAGSTARRQLRVVNVSPSDARVDLSPVVPVDPDPEVPPVEPLPQRPVCTIREYPQFVKLGQAANCKATYAGGPAERAYWRYRLAGRTTWLTSHMQVPPEPEHNYRFTETGNYEINLRVEGAGGSDETGSIRIITVEDIIVPEPDKPARQQIAFGPNLGTNIGQLFTEEELWDYTRQRISCFQLYVGHIISPGQDFVGQNTFDNLKQSGIFGKLNKWGVLLELQMASGETPTDVQECSDKIAGEQGHLGAICFDHGFIESTPEAWPQRLKGIKTLFPDMIIGAYAPFPTKSAEDIRKRLVEWDTLGGRPNFLRVDCDPNQTDKFTKEVFGKLRGMCDQRGMALQTVINAGDNATTDAKWVAESKKKFDYFLTVGKWDAMMVQSWASVPSDQDRQLPRNLLESEADSHTALVKYCLERFA